MAYEPVTPGGRRYRSRGNAIFWSILGAVALILLIWFIWDLFVDVDETEVGVVTIEDVVDNPQTYEGRVVTLRGEVAERLGPASFVLANQDVLLDERILVMSSTGDMIPIEETDIVMATGTVRVFGLASVETELGYDLQDDLYYDWEGKPVLMASRVAELVSDIGY